METTQVITVVVIEDEMPARMKILSQLAQLDNIKLLGVASSGTEAIPLINQMRPDLLLLDVELSDISGLDVLNQLEYKPAVIFTTAFQQHAVKAFEIKALDYLLKPFTLERLRDAIERVTLEEKKQDPISISTNKLICQQDERTYLIDIDRIYYIIANGGHSEVWEGARSLKVDVGLNVLEKRLVTKGFIRVHRKYLVNINLIHELQPWFNGKHMIIMADPKRSQISTSRSGSKTLFSIIRAN